MGEQHPPVVTDARRINLKTYLTVLLLGENHRQQQGYISLAGRRYTFVVQVTECNATGVLHRGQQVEATQRQPI